MYVIRESGPVFHATYVYIIWLVSLQGAQNNYILTKYRLIKTFIDGTLIKLSLNHFFKDISKNKKVASKFKVLKCDL